MCDPISVVTLGINTAATVMQFQGAKQAADQQNAYAQANAQSAYQSTLDQHAQLRIGQMQEQQSAAEEINQTAREARAAQATATVAAGEAGVGGVSVRGLLNEFQGRFGAYRSSIQTQQRWNDAQTEMSLRGITAQGQDRINSVRTVARPSFFDAALRIAGAGLGSYNDFKDRTDPLPQG